MPCTHSKAQLSLGDYPFAATSFAAWVATAFRVGLEQIEHWRNRAESRRALLDLDPHLLKDIGLTAGQARHEVAKPFWRQ